MNLEPHFPSKYHVASFMILLSVTNLIVFQTELINWLLSTSPEARPSATQIINSDILRKVRQDVLEDNQE